MPRREKILKVETANYDNTAPIEDDEEALLMLGLTFNYGVIAEVYTFREPSIDIQILHGRHYVPGLRLELSPTVFEKLQSDKLIQHTWVGDGRGGRYLDKHRYALSEAGHQKTRDLHSHLAPELEHQLPAGKPYEFQGVLLCYCEDDPQHLKLFCAFQDLHGNSYAVFLDGMVRKDLTWPRVVSSLVGSPEQKTLFSEPSTTNPT